MIVALTGVILMLFVIGHLLGNLQIFLGPRWVNDYAQHLRDLGPLLWLVRITLLTAVFLHIYFKARSRARHMVVSGLVVLAFIVFHLLHFTARKFNPQFPLLKNDPLNHY